MYKRIALKTIIALFGFDVKKKNWPVMNKTSYNNMTIHSIVVQTNEFYLQKSF